MKSDFDENLIKGKIAEAIFEQMFKEQGEFEVIPNGYEYQTPEIAQNLFQLENRVFFDRFRHMPDFVLYSKNKRQVFLVEVKFRKELDEQEIVKIASLVRGYNGPSYLFLATPENFYFESCNKIVEEKYIDVLPDSWIPKLIQEKYLNLLTKFIK